MFIVSMIKEWMAFPHNKGFSNWVDWNFGSNHSSSAKVCWPGPSDGDDEDELWWLMVEMVAFLLNLEILHQVKAWQVIVCRIDCSV